MSKKIYHKGTVAENLIKIYQVTFTVKIKRIFEVRAISGEAMCIITSSWTRNPLSSI